MQRRSFLGAALAAVAGLLGLKSAAPPESKPPLNWIERWNGRGWDRVLMRELRPGDIFIIDECDPWVIRATDDPKWLDEKSTWKIAGLYDPNDPIQSLPRPTRV